MTPNEHEQIAARLRKAGRIKADIDAIEEALQGEDRGEGIELRLDSVTGMQRCFVPVPNIDTWKELRAAARRSMETELAALKKDYAEL